MSATAIAPAPSLFTVAPDNWKLAIVIGLVGLRRRLGGVAACDFVLDCRRHGRDGGWGIRCECLPQANITAALLVSPAIAVLFVMNIFPLLWSLGLSFFAYQANQQSIRFVGLSQLHKGI